MPDFTVHYVTPELDSGPVIVEGSLNIEPGQSAADLQQRVHRIEHKIYPLVVEWLSENRLEYSDSGLTLDQNNLGPRGMELHYDNI